MHASFYLPIYQCGLVIRDVIKKLFKPLKMVNLTELFNFKILYKDRTWSINPWFDSQHFDMAIDNLWSLKAPQCQKKCGPSNLCTFPRLCCKQSNLLRSIDNCFVQGKSYLEAIYFSWKRKPMLSKNVYMYMWKFAICNHFVTYWKENICKKWCNYLNSCFLTVLLAIPLINYLGWKNFQTNLHNFS